MPSDEHKGLAAERFDVRKAVRDLLTRSDAYRRLPRERQQRIARGTGDVADYLVRLEPASAFAELVDAVDFPQFVGDLIHGVFHAIVDASIQQMEAYEKLIAAVSASLDDFRKTTVSDDEARLSLCKAYPPLCKTEGHAAGQRAAVAPVRLEVGDTLAARTWRRLASSRQQLLATMVVMGVNR